MAKKKRPLNTEKLKEKMERQMPNQRKPKSVRAKKNLHQDSKVAAPEPGVTDRLIEVPQPPEMMSSEAQEEWTDLAPTAHALGTLTRCDLRAFQTLCESLAMERKAQAQIASDGFVVEAAGGGTKQHPAIGALRDAKATSLRLFEQFGLTPKSRNYIKPAAEPQPNDGWGIFD